MKNKEEKKLKKRFDERRTLAEILLLVSKCRLNRLADDSLSIDKCKKKIKVQRVHL